jgi:hypothetical protein
LSSVQPHTRCAATLVDPALTALLTHVFMKFCTTSAGYDAAVGVGVGNGVGLSVGAAVAVTTTMTGVAAPDAEEPSQPATNNGTSAKHASRRGERAIKEFPFDVDGSSSDCLGTAWVPQAKKPVPQLFGDSAERV